MIERKTFVVAFTVVFLSSSYQGLSLENNDGIPALPHPIGPPTLSWFTAGSLPVPCWFENDITSLKMTNNPNPKNNAYENTTMITNFTTSLKGSSVVSVPIHPLYLLSYSKRIIIPNNTNTDMVNNTLILLGNYKGCKNSNSSSSSSTVFPMVYDPCDEGEVRTTFQRSYDYGETWDTCYTETLPEDLIKFGQSTLVFQHPKTINDPNSSHAAATPLFVFNEEESLIKEKDTCHLMCVFGGIVRQQNSSSSSSTAATVIITNTTTYQWSNVNTVNCCRLPECTTWLPQSSLPWGVSYGTAIQFGDSIYIIGGVQDNGKSSLFQTIVNFTTCSLNPWTIPIDEIPVAPRRIGIMATEMLSTKTLLIGGGTTISSTGEPLYPNPDLWATETPSISSSWRMLTPNLPLGSDDSSSNHPSEEDFTGIFDFTSIVTDEDTGNSLPLTWVYAARKAYTLVMDTIPPSVTLYDNLWYPNPSPSDSLLVPQIRQPVIMYDPLISTTGHPSIFALPVVTNDKYKNNLIRMDIVRCYDRCPDGSYTNGCTANPRDAVCNTCTECAVEGWVRLINKCQSQFLNYGDNECQDCFECRPGYEQIATYCNDTHDTTCEPMNKPNFVPTSESVNVDTEINVAILRMIFILMGSCSGFLVFLSIILAIRMSPNAHMKDRLVEITRYIRSLWPFAFSIASVFLHTCLAIGLVSIGGSKLFFNPAVMVLFIIIANMLGNSVVSYIVYRSVSLYSSSSAVSSMIFSMDILGKLKGTKNNLFSHSPTTTTTTVISPLSLSTTAFRSISRNNTLSVTTNVTNGSDKTNFDGSTSSYPTGGNSPLGMFHNNHNIYVPSPAVNNIQEFPYVATVHKNYGFRNHSTSNVFSSPQMKIFNLTLGLTVFHPRCLLHVYPNHLHGPSLLPSVRYIHSFAINWIAISTVTYDAPLLLICLIMLGNVNVVGRTSSAFILCALLGFINIVSTLSWSAAISAKIKASTVLSGGLNRSNNNSTLATPIPSPTNIPSDDDDRRYTRSSSCMDEIAEFADLNIIETETLSDSVLNEIIAPPAVVRSTINSSNTNGGNDISSNTNRQIAVARARGVMLPHLTERAIIASENHNEIVNDHGNNIIMNNYPSHEQPTDTQSLGSSIVSSLALSTTNDIPRAIANMRRQMELYPHDDSITGTNISIKDDASDHSGRTYLSSQVV